MSSLLRSGSCPARRTTSCFCGEVFEVQRPLPAVLVLQLGASVSGKIEETEGFAAMWEALRVSLTIPESHRLAATDE